MSARKARRPRRAKGAPPIPPGAGFPLLVALVAVLHAEGRPVAKWIADGLEAEIPTKGGRA